MEQTFFSEFRVREDLIDTYGDNALMIFALEMKYNIEDIHSVAEEALIDDSDDKETDLIYIDSENSTAIIAQGYHSSDMSKKEAPRNISLGDIPISCEQVNFKRNCAC